MMPARLDDLNYYLRRQEIFASMLISGTWTTPQRLTNDLIPDGRAALAGDAAHLRLAWTRDLDGDITTRGDTRIATTDWRDDVTGWRAFELLAAPTISATTSNSQVSVALAPPGQIGDHLAWTVDLDADLNTNGDRYLAWANNQSGAWNTAVLTEAQHMPAGIDSPSIDIRSAVQRRDAAVRLHRPHQRRRWRYRYRHRQSGPTVAGVLRCDRPAQRAGHGRGRLHLCREAPAAQHSGWAARS